MRKASKVESLTDELLGVVARWLQEAKSLRDFADECDRSEDPWEAHSADVEAESLERCTEEISEALQKAEGE